MTALFVALAAALSLAALAPLAPALLAGARPRAWRTAAVLGLSLPLAAGLLYARLGRPDVLDPPPPVAQPANPILQMVSRLAERLKTTPDDAEGWALLARAYETLQQPQKALAAYEQLERLRPGDAQVLSQHAVSLAMVQGNGLAGEPEALLQRALKVDPRHVPTLALLGSAAVERGEPAAALAYWRRLLAEVPADSDMAASIRDSISKVQTR
ncbi:MAG TPA: tetratricopeptide repeat protein [Roseateles sp.]